MKALADQASKAIGATDDALECVCRAPSDSQGEFDAYGSRASVETISGEIRGDPKEILVSLPADR